MKLLSLPEEKLNELAQDVSERMLAGATFADGIIRGEALKQFAEHKQINKFLIFQVYQVWDMQIRKLNHPYFNLDHSDIQTTLNNLKVQISQHIEISEEDFKPMLKRAVFNNLKLLLNPKETFANFFFIHNDSLPLKTYQQYAQFFSDMDFVVVSILKYHQKNGIDPVNRNMFFEKMEKAIEVYTKKTGIGFDSYREDIIQKLTGKSLPQIEEEVAQETQAKEEAERKEQEARMKAEEEQKRAEEEARRKEEEAAKAKAEEEARQKAEEEAQRRREEEERRREEEAKKVSFFDSLDDSDTFFDLEDEEETNTVVEEGSAEEPVVSESEAEVSEESEQPAEIIDQTAEFMEMASSMEPEESSEVVAETVETVTDEAEHITEEVAEVSDSVEDQAEEVVEAVEEVAESTESEVVAAVETVDEVVEETVDEVQEEVEETVEEVTESVAETIEEVKEEATEEVEAVEEEVVETVEEVKEEATEEVEAVQEAVAEEVEAVEEEVVEAVEEVKEEAPSKESTASFLERFLSKKENGSSEKTNNTNTSDSGTAKPASVLDRITDRKTKTVADKFSDESPQKVHENINGNRKIKLDEIPIHKQYQYVQKVFDGNNVRFRIIVDKVNNAKNRDEVMDILSKFVLANDGLDRNDAVVAEFIELLKNRY